MGFGVKVVTAPAIGKPISLLIHEHIREDNFDLYGFAAEEELIAFRQLTAVSGIGPKIGLLILKKGSLEEIRQAITGSDVDFFQSVTGVGKKSAQKLILELKAKLGQESDLTQILTDQHQSLKEALDSLGYKSGEYGEFLKKLPIELGTDQERITWLLKQLGQRNKKNLDN